MNATDINALKLYHRLLFRALIEMRAEGHEQGNKLVFHLADLFHNSILDLEAAAEGRITFEEVMQRLEQKAREKHCERWLTSTIEQIGTVPIPGAGTESEPVDAE